MEWSPPKQYDQTAHQPAPHASQVNPSGEWAPPPSFYQHAPNTMPPGTHQAPWNLPNYQPAPPRQQEPIIPPVNTSGEWAPPPSFYQHAPNTVPTGTHQAPWNLPNYQPAPPMRLELIIPPKYNGDVINEGSGKMYHLRTTDIHSTILSDTSGYMIGRIDWKQNPAHTVVKIRQNTWQQDQLLYTNRDMSHTFPVNHVAGEFTWKNVAKGIECFDASSSKVADFPYRKTSTIRIEQSQAAYRELIILTALLIHHEQSNHREGIMGRVGEGFTEGVAEGVISGILGGA